MLVCDQPISFIPAFPSPSEITLKLTHCSGDRNDTFLLSQMLQEENPETHSQCRDGKSVNIRTQSGVRSVLESKRRYICVLVYISMFCRFLMK